MHKLVKSLSYILSISLMVFLLPINNTNAATPTYNYEWVSQSGTISADRLAHEYTNLEAGQTLNLSLTLLNRSNSTIKKLSEMGPHGPDKAVAPGVWGIGSQTPYQDGTPHFLDLSSFVLNNNRFAYYEGNDVPNNGLITMNWNIKLQENLPDGVYNLYVRPVSEYLAWTRQIKNGKLLPTTSSDIYWRFVVGDGGQELYYMETFINTKEGYSFVYYPNVKDIHGWGMIQISDFGGNDPSLATNINVTDRGGWDKSFNIGFNYHVGKNISDEMSLEEYASQMWLENKNDPNPSPNKVVGLLTPNIIDGQQGYKFYVEGDFSYEQKNGWSGWFLNERATYMFFRTKSGKILTIEYTTDSSIAEMIVNSIQLI